MSQAAPREDREESDESRGLVDQRRAMWGGIFAGLMALAVVLIVGDVGDVEARLLLEATLPTIRFLASGVMAAAATILALMLTVLGITQTTEKRLRPVHFRRIRQISLAASGAIGVALLLLLVITFPLTESDKVPGSWYDFLYYGLMVLISVLGGLVVAIVLMLQNAIVALIDIVQPDRDSDLVAAEEASEEES